MTDTTTAETKHLRALGGEMTGKVAIVTGGSQGIGFHTARRLASLGVRVIVCARTADKLEAAAARIRQAGGACEAVPGSITDESVRQRLIDVALDRFGRLDILINSAGGHAGYTTESADLAVWRGLSEELIESLFRLCQLALPPMRRGEYGRIVTLSSGAAVGPTPGMALYTAMRAAQAMFVRQLALEVSQGGVITVNGLSPSFVLTEGVRSQLERHAKTNEYGEFVPDTDNPIEALISDFRMSYLKRLVTLDEVSETLCFLVSPLASAITGEILNLGGGWFGN